MKYIICIVIGIAIGFILFLLSHRLVKHLKKKKVSWKPSFTKIILSVILLTYFVGLIIGVKVTLLDYSQFGVLATYIATPTTTVIALYCWKSKAENMIKLKQDFPKETQGSDIDLNNITTG